MIKPCITQSTDLIPILVNGCLLGFSFTQLKNQNKSLLKQIAKLPGFWYQICFQQDKARSHILEQKKKLQN